MPPREVLDVVPGLAFTAGVEVLRLAPAPLAEGVALEALLLAPLVGGEAAASFAILPDARLSAAPALDFGAAAFAPLAAVPTPPPPPPALLLGLAAAFAELEAGEAGPESCCFEPVLEELTTAPFAAFLAAPGIKVLAFFSFPVANSSDPSRLGCLNTMSGTLSVWLTSSPSLSDSSSSQLLLGL